MYNNVANICANTRAYPIPRTILPLPTLAACPPYSGINAPSAALPATRPQSSRQHLHGDRRLAVWHMHARRTRRPPLPQAWVRSVSRMWDIAMPATM